MRAAKELIRQKLMDIVHTKKLMDKIISQTCESMTRNLSHQTEHATKSKANWEIQNTCDILLSCLEWPIFCVISCSLNNIGIIQSQPQF